MPLRERITARTDGGLGRLAGGAVDATPPVDRARPGRRGARRRDPAGRARPRDGTVAGPAGRHSPSAYGPDDAAVHLRRWRMFLMISAEVWGCRGGHEFLVPHHLFAPR